MTERKLDRAGKLVSGLAGERERWIVTVEVRRETWECLEAESGGGGL